MTILDPRCPLVAEPPRTAAVLKFSTAVCMCVESTKFMTKLVPVLNLVLVPGYTHTAAVPNLLNLVLQQLVQVVVQAYTVRVTAFRTTKNILVCISPGPANVLNRRA